MCTMPYAMRKWKWTVQTFFSYEFMRLVTTFENVEKEKPATTHASSYEILYDQKQRWNPVRNHTKRWAWPMRVCVCIADIEQSCLFQYLNQREKSKFCIVDHRKIGSICNLFMAQFFSLHSFYISFWARINGSSCAYILSKARNHMIRVFFLHFASTFESFNKTFQMQNAQF